MEVQEKINQIGNIIHAALNGEVIEDCIVSELNDRFFIDIDEESYTVILDEDLHYIVLEKSQDICLSIYNDLKDTFNWTLNSYFLRNEITFNSLNLDLADLEDNIVKHLLNNLNDLFVKEEYIGTYTINSESYYIFKLC